MAKVGRPAGLNRKAISENSLDEAHTFALYGEKAVKAPLGILNLARGLRMFSTNSEEFIDELLFKPIRELPKREPSAFEAACRAADAKKGLHFPPPTCGQFAAETMAEVVRLCMSAIKTGDAKRIRALADCLESVHRVDMSKDRAKQWHDPMFNPLNVLWWDNGQRMRDGKRLIPAYRADILRWVQRNFYEEGLSECTDQRLRVAMAAYGYVCGKGRRGGKRPGAGRPRGRSI